MPVSFNDKLSRWEALNTNLKQQIAELPHLQRGQEEFETLTRQCFEVVAEQDYHTGRKSQSVARRRVLEQQGNQLYEFLVAGLRHAYGPKSQKLREFGAKPRIRRSVKKEEPDPNEPLSPATATSHSLPPHSTT
jgi:hypothetical protein